MSGCFTNFYDSWFDHLHHLVNQLHSAPKPATNPDHHHDLLNLVRKVVCHYVEYYNVKSSASEHDPLSLFAAPWASTLERSLHWIAGWRPTTVFHLVYSESSILFESHIVDILRGLRTGDLGDLSPSQFRRVSELQCETVKLMSVPLKIEKRETMPLKMVVLFCVLGFWRMQVKEENAITEELSEWQDSACEMVNGSADLEEKIGRLAVIMRKADDLRLRTVRRVVDLLTPQQAVEFLIAAAELQFGVHGWGVNHDRRRGNV